MKNRRVMFLAACMCSVVFLSGCSTDSLMDKMMGTTTTVSSSASVDISKEDSDAVHVDASLEKPAFTVNPVESLEIESGSTNGKLTCEAAVSSGGTVTYQWYKNNVNSNGGGTLIEGATDTTYVPDTTTEGTDYYYVVATNTVDKTVSMATSTVAQVTVVPAGQGGGTKTMTAVIRHPHGKISADSGMHSMGTAICGPAGFKTETLGIIWRMTARCRPAGLR